MTYSQVQKISEMSDIFPSYAHVLQSMHLPHYCFYIETIHNYPQINIMVSSSAKVNLLHHYFRKIQKRYPTFVFLKKTISTIHDEPSPAFTLPITRQNISVLKKILHRSGSFKTIDNYFSKFKNSLSEHFLDRHQISIGYDLLQQIYQYTQHQTIIPLLDLNLINVIQGIDEPAIESLQRRLLTDPISPVFINHDHQIIINDMLIDELHFIFKMNPKFIIQQYNERQQQEQALQPNPHKFAQAQQKLGYHSDIFLCSVLLPKNQNSIFSSFQMGLYNEQNKIYSVQTNCASFQKRIKQDVMLKDLDIPRFEILLNLLEIPSRWDMTRPNSSIQAINPTMTYWQFGLHYQPIMYPLKLVFAQTHLNKLNDARLATHLLSMPYPYFQIIILFFNCLYNPLLYPRLISLIDLHLEHHHIHAIPFGIIEHIQKKYATKGRLYQKINAAYYHKEIMPEIRDCLLAQTKNHILNIQSLHENAQHHETLLNITIYDEKNHQFTEIQLECVNPFAYLFEEILKLKNPENFNLSWVQRKKRYSLHHVMHATSEEEVF